MSAPPPAGAVRLRPAEESDTPGILELERELFPLDAWSEDTVRAELRSPHTRYLVLEDGRRVLGYAGMLAPAGSGEADVQTLAVASAVRRAGHARRMLGELRAWAAGRGAAAVFLEVRETALAARALYEQLGFVEIGRREGYYAGDGADAIVMRADAGPGPETTGR
ncbi:MAG: ribosomal protein S18-alanine N-acetyltransferase [Pseudoclavibacter sp.]|nr:ribosomal protein S18-alanine N-acetyltransferase [Pseudoclavibacter sp.]